MAAAHVDAAVFGYSVYSQGVENTSQDDVRSEEKSPMFLYEPCFCSKEDFIVLAEFSEVTGPIPLLTIPSNAFSYGDIDVNALIMKIMSLDYQSSPSGEFAFSKDVQVLQSEVLPGWHAYVHYATLHDLRARGFVRPLCFAYISPDHSKLEKQFDLLRKEFLTAVEILKYNNIQTFIDEISKVLANLKHMQNQYFMWKKKEEDGLPLTSEERWEMARMHLDQIAHQHTELRHMLLSAELQGAGSEWAEELLAAWETALHHSQTPAASTYIHSMQVTPSVSTRTSEREALRAVLSLSPWGTAALLSRLLMVHRRLSCCPLTRSLNMFASAVPVNHIQGQEQCSPQVVLEDREFILLLSCAATPFQWADVPSPSSSLPVSFSARDPHLSGDLVDYSLVASGNEATSSSYHSAPESLNDFVWPSSVHGLPDEGPPGEGHYGGGTSRDGPTACGSRGDAFVDLPSDSDSEFEREGVIQDDDEARSLNCWNACAWSVEAPPVSVVGRRLARFFQRRAGVSPHVAPHVALALLTGRTLVVAAGEARRGRVQWALAALAALVPHANPRILWWHRGILVSSHVSSHDLIGICVPERLSVHDMISPRDKNLVTILDLATNKLCGPAYSGQLLSSLKDGIETLPSDHALLLLLQAVADGIREKLLVLRASSLTVAETLAVLNITGSDADILKHLMHSLPGKLF